MNQNIEVINPGLWAVNFQYLPYIADIKYHSSDPDALEKPASIKDDGCIVLNKSHELYPTLKLFMPNIMANTDDELSTKVSSMKNMNRDGYDQVYRYCLELEQKRRLTKRQSKERPIIKKIVNFIGRR